MDLLQNFLVVILGASIAIIFIKLQKNKKPHLRSVTKQKQDYPYQSKYSSIPEKSKNNNIKTQQQFWDENIKKLNIENQETTKEQQSQLQNINSNKKSFSSLNTSNSFNLYKSNVLCQGAEIQNHTVFSKTKEYIFKLYDLSCRNRDVTIPFIGPEEDLEQLMHYYHAQEGEELWHFLKNYFVGFRQIRGDGNCYYNSFIYQFFKILLEFYSPQQFDDFLKDIEKMEMFIYYPNFQCDQQFSNAIGFSLAIWLRTLKRNPTQLYHYMKDPNQEFYGLAIIFIRNLAYNQCVQNQNKPLEYLDKDLFNEVLYWENQCNSTEMLNNCLSNCLQIQLNVYLIDQKKQKYQDFQYGKNKNPKIHLLFESDVGHYQIGISKLF